MEHRLSPIDYRFPQESPHAAIPLGNGLFGALVRATGHTVHAAINRQDYWNRRGRIVWGPDADYTTLRDSIVSSPGRRFESYEPRFIGFAEEGMPRPTRMPVGRFDMVMEQPIAHGRLDPASAMGEISGLACFVAPKIPVVYFGPAPGNPGGLDRVTAIRPVPNESPEVRAYWAKHQMPPPRLFFTDGLSGWVQVSHGDPVMCAAALRRNDAIVIALVLAETEEEAIHQASAFLKRAPAFAEAAEATRAWQTRWWASTPRLRMDHGATERAYALGMYGLSGFTRPGGPAPTLQGPWIEDDRMPPWQSDYHFNINVQMAHWPMLAGNHLEQFEPVSRMLGGWMPAMKAFAKAFVGVDDGIMLPHGADDTGQPADTNWKCQFDPGSGAWMALQLWDIFRYGGDRRLLGDLTWPMLTGSLRVYEAMLERGRDGSWGFHAPSPEFMHAGGPAWGRNPSFHLAIIHGLLRAVERAASALGREEPRLPGWKETLGSLPAANVDAHGEILIWDGLPLRESHRHHSHLAGIYPFETIPFASPVKPGSGGRPDLHHTFYRWSQNGTAAWTGWCMPWAVMLWSRFGRPDAVMHLIESYERFFIGPNHFSSHNTFSMGFSGFLHEVPPFIMQMDAPCGMAAAILDLLARSRFDQIELAPCVPDALGDIAFEGIRLPGGVYASGVREAGRWTRLVAEGA